MKNLFKVGALAVLISFGSMEVFADVTPTVSDAHQLIRDLTERHLITLKQGNPVPLIRYSGDGCDSALTYQEGYRIEINWGEVSSVGDIETTVLGRIPTIFQPRQVLYYDNRVIFHTDNPRIGKQLSKAIQLLISSCTEKSKFD